jgi:hypothetical protein
MSSTSQNRDKMSAEPSSGIKSLVLKQRLHLSVLFIGLSQLTHKQFQCIYIYILYIYYIYILQFMFKTLCTIGWTVYKSYTSKYGWWLKHQNHKIKKYT